MGAHHTSISVSFASRCGLDQLKNELGVTSYEQVIQCLLKSRKMNIPSTAGCDPDIPSFTRETGGDSLHGA